MKIIVLLTMILTSLLSTAGEGEGPFSFDMPGRFGRIREAWAPAEKSTGETRVVFHVQDAHSHYGAQKNSVRILEYLAAEFGVDLIMIEAAVGDVDTSRLATFPDPRVKREVAEHYLKNGKLTGAEYFSIVTERPVQLVGVEDRELYTRNLRQYRRSLEFRDVLTGSAGRLRQLLLESAEPLFSPQLMELVKMMSGYREKRHSIRRYIAYLVRTADAEGLELEIPDARLFLEAAERSKTINVKEVEKERADLIDRLKRRLSQEEISDLFLLSMDYRLGRTSSATYFDRLLTLCREKRLTVGEYSKLAGYVSYLKDLSGISKPGLVKDRIRLEDALVEKLCRPGREKDLYSLISWAGHVRNLLLLRMSSDHLERFRVLQSEYDPERIREIAAELMEKEKAEEVEGLLAEVEPFIRESENFYEIATERDQKLLENTLEELGKRGKKAAVLITGGFHTSGITRLLRAAGISYFVLTPELVDGNGGIYESVISGKLTPYEDFMDRIVGGEALLPPLPFDPTSDRQNEEERARRRTNASVEVHAVALMIQRLLGEGASMEEVERTIRAVETEEWKGQSEVFVWQEIQGILDEKGQPMFYVPMLEFDRALEISPDAFAIESSGEWSGIRVIEDWSSEWFALNAFRIESAVQEADPFADLLLDPTDEYAAFDKLLGNRLAESRDGLLVKVIDTGTLLNSDGTLKVLGFPEGIRALRDRIAREEGVEIDRIRFVVAGLQPGLAAHQVQAALRISPEDRLVEVLDFSSADTEITNRILAHFKPWGVRPRDVTIAAIGSNLERFGEVEEVTYIEIDEAEKPFAVSAIGLILATIMKDESFLAALPDEKQRELEKIVARDGISGLLRVKPITVRGPEYYTLLRRANEAIKRSA